MSQDLDWIVGLVEEREPKTGPRGTYKKRAKPGRPSRLSN